MLAKDNVALRVMPVRLWKEVAELEKGSSGYLGSTFTTGSRIIDRQGVCYTDQDGDFGNINRQW